MSGGGGQGARAAGRAVQQQMQARCGEPGEGVGVAQSAGAADRVAGAAAVGERVAQRADAQPALVLVAAHGLGEPGCLVAADEAVLLLLAVAVGDGGVESGDDGAQFGHREEGPGLVAVEDGVQSLVEAAEQAGVVAPLGPVRRLRCHLVGLAGVEVGRGGGLVHVLCARDDHHALGRQVELGAQGGEEAEGLVALAGAAGGGEVAGDDHQVGGRGSRVPEHDQVAADLAAERVGFAAPPEVGPGQVQDGHGVVAAAGGSGRGGLRIEGRPGRTAAARPAGAGERARPEPARVDLLGEPDTARAAARRGARRGAGRGARRGARRAARSAAGVAGPPAGAGVPVDGLLDPGEQQGACGVGVGDAHQVDVGDRGEESLDRHLVHPDGQEASFG